MRSVGSSDKAGRSRKTKGGGGATLERGASRSGTALLAQRDRQRLWLAIALAGNLVFWIVAVAHELMYRGLFPVLGVDWSRFWGASRAFDSAGPAAAYSLAAIQSAMQPLARFTPLGAAGVRVGPVPYPPIFVAFFSIFTLPPAPVGFAAWTLFSLALLLLVAFRLSQLSARLSPLATAGLLLGTFPLLMSLFAGQVVGLLLVFLTEAVVAFKAGKELRGGVWLGLMLLKPQYVVWLLLVILLKRRWAAVLGAAIAGVSILVSSLAVGGLAGLIGYVSTIVDLYPRYQGNVAIDPRGMIGWRAIVVTVLPHLTATDGLVVTVLLSAVTLMALPLIWRGDWVPATDRFQAQLLGTLSVTLLVAYHNQIHGAALLAVPSLLLLSAGAASRVVRSILVGSLFLMPIVGVISALAWRDVAMVGPVTSVLIALLLVALLRGSLAPAAQRRVAASATP